MRALLFAWLALLAMRPHPVGAADQRIRLRNGWNLVSFAVTPDDPSPAAVLRPLENAGLLQALWAYDAATGTWSTYPSPPPGVPAITVIDTAHGYWLKVSQVSTLDVTAAADALPTVANLLVTGWNLISFPAEQPIAYDIALGDPAVREIWSFDATARVFQGIVIDAVTGRPSRLDFTRVEAGRGYWVRTGQSITQAPELITLLPPDVDFPPLVQGAEVDKAVPFTRSAGDVDIGGDGLYDRPRTQRAITFGQNAEQLRFTIYNGRTGLLSWRATLDGFKTRTGTPVAPFAFFRVDDPETRATTRAERVRGLSAGDTNQVTLVADRSGLPPGAYEARLRIASNATFEGLATENARDIRVLVDVGDFDGLYEVTARIDTVEGRAARLANPRFVMAVYGDTDGLKGVIDDRISVFFPKRLRLTGGVYQSGTSRLELSGALALDANDADNPYGKVMRRDITLRGARRTPGNPADAAMAPLDLRGEYLETIRGVLPTPIRMVGTFLARQVSPTPQLMDESGVGTSASKTIPDNGVLNSKLIVTVKQLISEVDVTVNLDHPDPTDLKVTVIAPDGTQVVLRDHGAGFLGPVIYDERVAPVQSLAAFVGHRSKGDWTLRVEDTRAGSTGSLKGWSLRVRGTEIHSLSGTIAGVGAGKLVHLTGCGVSRIGTTGAGGSYLFDDLIDCPYQITLLTPGYRSPGTQAVVGGQDLSGLNFAAVTDPGFVAPPPITLPTGGGTMFTALTTSGGAGLVYAGKPGLNPPVPPAPREQQYGADAATYDLDRLPLVTAQSPCPGDEDTNAFGLACDDVTFSHVVEDGTCKIDGPDCPNAFRAVVAMGFPLVGYSVAGDRQLFIGANP